MWLQFLLRRLTLVSMPRHISRSYYYYHYYYHYSKDKPLAGAKCPAGNDPHGQHDDQEDCTRADGHQGLEHKSSVEADTVQCADTSWRRVGEETTMQQHHATDEIQTQKHRQRQQQVHGHFLRTHQTVTGIDWSPREVESSRQRVNGTDSQLDT